MKNKIWLTTLVVTATILLMPISSFAWDHIHKNDCSVTKTIDDSDHDGSIRAAEMFFNRTGDYQACREKILFTLSDSIKIKMPIVLTGDTGSKFIFGAASIDKEAINLFLQVADKKCAEEKNVDTANECLAAQLSCIDEVEKIADDFNSKTAGYQLKSLSSVCGEVPGFSGLLAKTAHKEIIAGNALDFGGHPAFSGKATDDIDTTALLVDGEETAECLIYIKTSNVTVENLYIKGNGTKYNGICIDASNITLKNVVISGIGGDAIRLGKNTTNLTFEGIVAIDQNVGVGIRIMSKQESLQTPVGLPFGPKYNDPESPVLDLLGASQDVLLTDSKAKIDSGNMCISLDSTTNTYTLTGTAECTDCSENQQIKRLYVFRVPDGYSADELGNIGLAEMVGTYDATDTGGIVGLFSIPLGVGANEEGAGKLFVIPETSPGIFGSSSKAIILQHQTNCAGAPDKTPGSGSGKITMLDSNGVLNMCLMGVDPTISGIGSDSDGDTIPDIVEMKTLVDGGTLNTDKSRTFDISLSGAVKGSCDCNSTYLCWYKPDSDSDGVSDKKDGYIAQTKSTMNWVITLEDTDGDGTPNVADEDSDDDGIKDGKEDRSRLYNPGGINNNSSFGRSKAYYFYYDSNGSYVQDSQTGAMLPCYNSAEASADNLVNDLSYDTDMGISYGLYFVDANRQLLKGSNGGLFKYGIKGAIPTEAGGVVSLECRNIRLADDRNFNGEYNMDNGETHLKNKDTDGDLICDGLGICKGMTKGVGDPCPNTPSKIDEKFCELNCVDNEITNGIAEDFIKLDVKGKVIELLKYTAEDNVEQEKIGDIKLYDKIKENPIKAIQEKYCSDIDGDQIPDCLEFTGSCQDLVKMKDSNNKTGGQFFNPYTKDTDKDGFVDGPKQNSINGEELKSDKCPFTYGENDGNEITVDSGLGALSCGNQAYYIYNYQPLLAYFLDRDDDTIKDGFEDKNQNGGIPEIKKGKKKADIEATETDPLMADSDGDKIDDQYEVSTFKTNPSDEDTDGDGLLDGVEVGFDGDPTSLNINIGSHIAKDGICWEETKDFGDTNPLDDDTDGDGISDGIEIKMGTNPANIDSDGDKVNDGIETKKKETGNWPLYDDDGMLIPGTYDFEQSNPCSGDTDKDGSDDKIDSSPSLSGMGCEVTNASSKYGVDRDCDGLPDNYEIEIGTDPDDKDTDKDGLMDGCGDKGNGDGELCWHVKNGKWTDNSINVEEFESNPGVMDDEVCTNNGQDTYTIKHDYGKSGTGAGNFCGIPVGVACGSDTDGDGIPDKYEKAFGTKPGVADTDGDGIIDGLEVGWIKAQEVSPGAGIFWIVKGATKSSYMANSGMTDPKLPDTDGDGLCDGFCSALDYEVKNCIGPSPQLDANFAPMNTDPKLADSDGDGASDGDEVKNSDRGGAYLDVARAITPTRGGCGNIGGSGGETWGMTIMFGALLVATRMAKVVLRKTKKSRRACSAKAK